MQATPDAECISLVSGNPALVKAAMKAVSHLRYQPAMFNGTPINCEYNYRRDIYAARESLIRPSGFQR
jgi:hypothetical protein